MVRTLTVLFCLAACGGGGNEGNSARDRLADFTTLETRVTGLGETPANQWPDSGTLIYAGLVRLDLPLAGQPPTAFIGALELTVAFDASASPVVGDISHLENGSGQALGGVLQVSGGALFPDADPDRDYQFGAVVTGDLTGGARAYAIDAELAGDFHGRGAEAVAGVIFGDMSSPDGVDVFDGAFAAALP